MLREADEQMQTAVVQVWTNKLSMAHLSSEASGTADNSDVSIITHTTCPLKSGHKALSKKHKPTTQCLAICEYTMCDIAWEWGRKETVF